MTSALTFVFFLTFFVIQTFGLTNFADTKCGQRLVTINPKISREGRIVGGAEAIRGEFPWIVSLQFNAGPQTHFCGGFLINNRYAITAAHCLDSISKNRIQVIIGEHVIGVEEVPTNAFGVGVEQIIRHPDFTVEDTTRNDIALLRLQESISWNSFVQPACLPNAGDAVPLGEKASVAGWGYTTKEHQSTSKTLMTVDIPVISTRRCEEDYEWVGSETQFCAGSAYEGRGACKGDSGSPLMFWDKTNDSLSVVGIHAGGRGCGTGMLSGIYTRVASYVNWIKYNLKR